jgi:uncharacterized protein involved in type VI secretion and phage assembly
VDALRNFLVQTELIAFQHAVQLEGKWTLQGEDAFSDESYPLPGKYDTRANATQAARTRLEELERTQPSVSSGGQAGLQDRVYIVDPQGKASRIF